ncbi:hypothetical protein J7413_20230 [Shimia sp. R10_1]|uniref:hypothetical protein n=1 Tax=Shimia sp. R10_1 TaxID=2821095 RepID=UPI001ADC47B5|nr:hypothetical protein [Shimia sp. R10_1]MBO9475868.1 hypothetical protein [Shimia sp. R10_1]
MNVPRLLLSVILAACPALLLAQMDPAEFLAESASEEISIGQSWAQFQGTEELLYFLFNVAAVVAFTALLVFHPVRRGRRRNANDLMMPQLFFLYALIGMVVGFLVVQHGSMIGFVVFGIGALLRFRSNLDDPIDTVEMILVTILGLAVGLGLPVMALCVALTAWSFIWLSGRKTSVSLSVRGQDVAEAEEAAQSIQLFASTAGWQLINKHQTPGKARVDLLFLANERIQEAQLETKIAQTVSNSVEVKVTL